MGGEAHRPEILCFLEANLQRIGLEFRSCRPNPYQAPIYPTTGRSVNQSAGGQGLEGGGEVQGLPDRRADLGDGVYLQ